MADDDTGALYISEENEALWRYSAEPDDGTAPTRQAVDILAGAGGHLVNDIEGVTIVDQGEGTGYVIVSVQNAARSRTRRTSVSTGVRPAIDFVNTFRVANGIDSDDCDRTDGITAMTADLGPAFPHGMFVCQDNNNDPPRHHWEPEPEDGAPRERGESGRDAPPPARSVSSGDPRPTRTPAASPLRCRTRPDPVTCYCCSSRTGARRRLSEPGAGWSQIGRLDDIGQITTVWRKVATASDAGTSVRLTTDADYNKVGLTLAAYRGVDTSSPVATIVGHQAPTVPVRTPLRSSRTTWRARGGCPSGRTRTVRRRAGPRRKERSPGRRRPGRAVGALARFSPTRAQRSPPARRQPRAA